MGARETSWPALLLVPPFPGSARIAVQIPARGGAAAGFDPGACVAALRRLKVGGTFWGPQPDLPAGGGIVAVIRDETDMAEAGARAARLGLPLVGIGRGVDDGGCAVPDGCDPWHLLGWAREVLARPGEPLAVLAALAGVPVCAPGGATAPGWKPWRGAISARGGRFAIRSAGGPLRHRRRLNCWGSGAG